MTLLLWTVSKPTRKFFICLLLVLFISHCLLESTWRGSDAVVIRLAVDRRDVIIYYIVFATSAKAVLFVVINFFVISIISRKRK